MLLCGKGDNGTVYVIYEFNFNSQYSRQNTNIIKEHKIQSTMSKTQTNENTQINEENQRIYCQSPCHKIACTNNIL